MLVMLCGHPGSVLSHTLALEPCSALGVAERLSTLMRKTRSPSPPQKYPTLCHSQS